MNKEHAKPGEILGLPGVERKNFFAHIAAKRNKSGKIKWPAFSVSPGFAVALPGIFPTDVWTRRLFITDRVLTGGKPNR